MSIEAPARADFLKSFRAGGKAARPQLIVEELVANRDSFRCLVAVAAARTIDHDSFVEGLRLALEQDPANLPGLRLMSWHQIRASEWAMAKETLRTLISHWPKINDTRRELLRVDMLSGGADGEELLKLAGVELHNDLARQSYRCQYLVAHAQAASAVARRPLRLEIDHASVELFRKSGDPDGVGPRESEPVFGEVLTKIAAARSVALIGNGPSLKGSKRGAEIDDHDLVIRCNFPPFTRFKDDVGSRADIVFFNESLVESIPRLTAQEPDYRRCLALALHPEPTPLFKPETYSQNFTKNISRIPLELRHFYRSFFYAGPTTGLMGIILISIVMGKDLDIYGFDFYRQSAAHYFATDATIYLGHELQYEQWFLETFLPWLDMGTVSAGRPAAEITL